jgi:hypothetical protein
LSVLVKKVRFRDPQPDSFPIIPCDGIPFVVVGRKLLECHQGIDRDGHRKEELLEKNLVEDLETIPS